MTIVAALVAEPVEIDQRETMLLAFQAELGPSGWMSVGPSLRLLGVMMAILWHGFRGRGVYKLFSALFPFNNVMALCMT